jgi:hypothetical protein
MVRRNLSWIMNETAEANRHFENFSLYKPRRVWTEERNRRVEKTA